MKNKTMQLLIPIMLLVIVSFSFCILFFSSLWSQDKFNWSEITLNMKDSIIEMPESSLDYGPVGNNASYTPHYYRRLWISKHLTLPESQRLLHYPAPSIKALAIEKILQNDTTKLQSIRKQLDNDSSFILIGGGGCIYTSYLLSEFAEKVILEKNFKKNSTRTKLQDLESSYIYSYIIT